MKYNLNNIDDLKKAIVDLLDGCYNTSDTPYIDDDLIALKDAIIKSNDE